MTPKLRGILQVKTTQCVLLVPHKFQSNGSTINRSRITGHFKEITLISSKMAMSSASNSKSWVKKIATTQGVAFEDVFSEKLHVHQNGQIKGVLNWQPRVGILIQPSVGPLTLGSDPLLVTNDLEIFTYRPLAEWLSQKKKKKKALDSQPRDREFESCHTFSFRYYLESRARFVLGSVPDSSAINENMARHLER